MAFYALQAPLISQRRPIISIWLVSFVATYLMKYLKRWVEQAEGGLRKAGWSLNIESHTHTINNIFVEQYYSHHCKH